MKKRINIIAVGIVATIITICGIVFVSSTSLSSLEPECKRKEVAKFDILQWQFERELEIIADYNKNKNVWTIQRPYIIIDPYDINPLAALVMFEIEQNANIEVTIIGDDESTTFTYEKNVKTGRAEIPIIGLYADRSNVILLKVKFEDNTSELSTFEIKTEALPQDFQIFHLVESKPEKMEEGITLFITQYPGYVALVDQLAQVRGFFIEKWVGDPTIMLANGNILATRAFDPGPIREMNWLGKIFKEYEVPRFIHHSLYEMPNGNILAVSYDFKLPLTDTRQDQVAIIERNTGEIIKVYDFKEILGFISDFDSPNPLNWLHINAVLYDEPNNAIIVSGRERSAIVSIDADTSEINWILSQYYWANDYEHLRPYILNPVGVNFEWFYSQHYPTILPSSIGNSVDLLLFDNGRGRKKSNDEQILAENNYSRAVQYHINTNDMTVRQSWQYGKERGTELYSHYLSAVQYLKKTNNRLITFGSASDGKTSSVIEVSKSGEVVFEISLIAPSESSYTKTFKSYRISQYSSQSYDYSLGEIRALRYGQNYIAPRSSKVIEPELEQRDVGERQPRISKIVRREDNLWVLGWLWDYWRAIEILQEVSNIDVDYSGEVFLIFRDGKKTYIFESYVQHYEFDFYIDLTELTSGTYEIDFFALGEYFRTNHKITIDNAS